MERIVKTLKKYFIPHEANDHKPHLLRAPAVAFVCLLAIIIESAFLFGSFLIPRTALFGEIVVNALVTGTNQARVTDGLAPLRENALLDVAAQEKASDMVNNDYFAHTSPTGVTPWYWFANVGYRFTAAGENLAVNFTDSQDVTNAWLNSPEHRANILDAGYTDIGMATAQGEFQGHPATYVVELFGTPAAPIALAPVAQAAVPPAPSPKPAPVATTPQIVTTTAAGTAAVAIAGANTVTPTASATAPLALNAPVPAAVSELNPVQAAAADPRHTVDYIYFAIALLFAAALLMNMFMKVHLHHPQLIFGGMIVILVAGLLIVLNQHFGAAGVVIL
jgi:Cysteine-rich secretory protein family